jgi:hypothetical protein
MNCGRYTILEMNVPDEAEVSWVTANRRESKPCHFGALQNFRMLEIDCPNRR